MSTSLASAKKRRANISEPQPQQFRQQPQQQQQQPGVGLTLQQVIKLVDTRLTTLEKIVSDQKNGAAEETETGDWIEEFNKRTEIIAIEMDNIKSTVLQLQTFTMEVNKKMFEKLEALTAAVPTPAPAPAPVTEPVSADSDPVGPAITLEITPSTAAASETPSASIDTVLESSNVPVISRFENKSKKNNNAST
jgi:hypothetical protein